MYSKNDTVDLWLLTILQDLALARYSCVIASESRTLTLSPEQGALLVGSQDAISTELKQQAMAAYCSHFVGSRRQIGTYNKA